MIMRFLLLILLFWRVVNTGYTQNLVPNPSFEEVDSLPVCIEFLHSGKLISNYLLYWDQPTAASTDFWTNLLTINCLPDENELMIPQLYSPRTGNNMCGILTYTNTGLNKNYREYLEVSLLPSATTGKSYYSEMYVAFAKKRHVYATNNLGMYFSDTLVDIKNNQPNYYFQLPFNPQIVEKKIIESEDWTKVSGCFKAKSNYKYVLIGNFFTDEKTLVKEIFSPTGSTAYYLIDDVSVTELPYDLPEYSLGKDTTLCEWQDFVISPRLTMDSLTYRWQDGTSQATCLVRYPGVYWVDVTRGVCTVRDSLVVRYERPISLGKDTVLCKGESLILNIIRQNRQYLWSDGSSSNKITVNQSGKYWVQVLSDFCEISDTIQVDFIDCPSLIPNIFTPNQDSKNQTFYIENIDNRPWGLLVYNRWGGLVYQSLPYHNNWRGKD